MYLLTKNGKMSPVLMPRDVTGDIVVQFFELKKTPKATTSNWTHWVRTS